MGYYTPEQAQTKICPYLTMGGRMENCKTGACMLWRWEDGEGPDDVDPPEPDRVFKGYCGMAGHPGQDVNKPKPTGGHGQGQTYDASDRPAIS